MLDLDANAIIVLAVQWDEVLGPAVLSLAPEDMLEDPSGVALQIYMASVTVFGQMGNTLRTEFSVPLLSLGTNHIVRVAFDSWPDESVRGRVRPFYLAIVTTKETQKQIDQFLDKNIWLFVDELKALREQFSCQKMLDKIIESRHQKIETVVSTEVESIEVTLPPDYTVYQAIDDFNNARKLWNAENRDALMLALRSALRLSQDERYHEGAGQAAFLAAQIFMFGGNLQSAYEYFCNASREFNQARIFEKSASALYNASMSAYKNKNFVDAEKRLKEALSNLTDYDYLRLARFSLQLAQIYYQLANFKLSDKTFSEALEYAEKGEDYSLAARIATAHASRLSLHAESVSDETRVALIEYSAENRIYAAELFKKQNAFSEAGTSYVMAAQAYAQMENYDEALESFKLASKIFLGINRFREAGNAIFDAVRIAQKAGKNLDALELLNKAQECYQKIEDPVVRAQMIGNCLAKGPDLYIARQEYFYAVKAHELALNYIEKNPDLPLELSISIYISAANFFFNQGRFDNAGDLFARTCKFFSNVSPERELEEQRKKCQQNAFTSYKRAADVFYSTGRALLYESHKELALEMFEKCLRVIKNAIEVAPPNKNEESLRLMNNQITLLNTISSYFEEDERKFLAEIIEKYRI
ncbi:MAG: hypothetical protein ACFFDI_13205 [Promethearchaeota archaeon]